MFGFGKKKQEEVAVNAPPPPEVKKVSPEYARECAEAYKSALNNDNQILVTITNPSAISVESLFTDLSPDEIVTMYNYLEIRMKNMKEHVKKLEKYYNDTVELFDEQVKGGLPEEEATKMKESAKELLEMRKLGFTRLEAVVVKMKRIVETVSDYTRDVKPEQLDNKW